MEGSNWLRLGAVVAMFVGAIYVLLPTLLQEDLDARLARQASTVEAPARQQADLDLTFAVREGDPQVLAQQLGQRLAAAGVPTSRVEAQGSEVHVFLAVGGDPARVEQAAQARGEVTLADPRAAAPPAEASAGTPDGATAGERTFGGMYPDFVQALQEAGVDASVLDDLAGVERPDVPAEAVIPADFRAVSRQDGRLVVQRDPLPEGWPFALVLVDGRPVGGLIPTEGGWQLTPFTQLDAPVAAALAGPLDGALERVDQPVQAAPEQVAEAPADAGGSAPAWLLSLLPDTQMNLGLDLQGGLDLTLQVGLDEAVQAQVSRDAAYMRDQAQRDGFPVEDIRRDRVRPMLWVTSSRPLSEVQGFVRKAATEYTYAESEGNRHAFALNAQRVDELQDQAVEQVLETLRKRVDATGVKEPSIVRKGGGQINVQLPGEVDLQAAVDALGTTAVLEFHLVDEDFDGALLDRIVTAASEQMPADQFNDDQLLNEWLWDTGRLPTDRLILWEYAQTTEGESRSYPLPLYADALLTGNDISNAGVGWDQNQQPFVSLDFKPRGGRVFCDVTAEWVGKRFAIVLDDQVQSAPSIRERICGGSARIDMASSIEPLKEAQTLALVLRTGSLDAPVELGGVRQVGATLGQDAIRSGMIASLIGSLLVISYMVLWYKWSGVLADIALMLNVLLVLTGLALFGATLTLPGIAGIALTVGMAVDSNIIIFERIREELKLGVHPRKAVDVGFEKALSAILDANITTAIAGIVLFSYGTGPIRGFAVTLLIGIVTTLITALFVTRTLLDAVTRSSATRLSI